MRSLTLKRVETDVDPKTSPTEAEVAGFTRLDLGTVVVDKDTGEDVIIYSHSGITGLAAAKLTAGIEGVRWDGIGSPRAQEFRLSGIRNAYRTFGYTQPVPLRSRYGCSRCRFTKDHPDLDGQLESVARRLADVFDDAAAYAARDHRDLLGDVADRWWYGGAPWTAGIINWIAALPYHRDAGNIKGAWSAMLTLRREVDGGELVIPEYKLVVPVEHRSVLFFDGGSLLHGVTPLKLRTSDLSSTGARRTTIVFYTKSGMVRCADTHEEEIARARASRTAGEDRIAEALQ